MGLDDDLDDAADPLAANPPDYGDGPKDADHPSAADTASPGLVTPTTGGVEEFPGPQAGPADLSDSSGDPADDPVTENLADAEQRAGIPGDLAVDPKGEYADHDNDGLPDAAWHDYAGEPVPDVPAPVTPDTPTDEAQRRVSYERLINDQWSQFVVDSQVAFIDHKLAGRDVRLVAYNADGSEYDPDDDGADTVAIAGPSGIGEVTVPVDPDGRPYEGTPTMDHDAIVEADEDSTDLDPDSDNPVVDDGASEADLEE